MLGAVMPFWYIGSLVLSAIWAVAVWSHPGTVLVVIAAGLLVVSVVMSVLVLVPINNRSKTWTTENRPADWKEQSDRWDRYHYGRVGVLVAAFTLLAVALVRPARRHRKPRSARTTPGKRPDAERARRQHPIDPGTK